MAVREDEFQGELRFGQQLMRTVHVAAGGLSLFMALLFLVAGPSLQLLGGVSSAAALLAGLVIGLTLLNGLELLGGSGERGGTYILVQETVKGFGGFITGWAIIAAMLTLSAAFARSAASHILLIFPTLPIGEGLLALILGSLLVLIQLFRLLPRREWLWPTLVGLFVILTIVLVSSLLSIDPEDITAAPPISSSNLLQTSAWIVIGYAAIETTLSIRRQIRDASSRLPRALLLTFLLGTLIVALILLLSGRIPADPSHAAATGFADAIGSNGWFPTWVVTTIGILVLMLASSCCLMTCARQIHIFSQQGTFPPVVRRLRSPFRLPPILFLAIFLIMVPLTLLVPIPWLTNISAAAILVAMIMLSVAAIYSRRTEPERRRTLLLPFFPLVPSIALSLDVALLLALPSLQLLALSIWLLIGAVFYLSYARARQVEAQEGVLTFGPDPHREKTDDVYRILVPLSTGLERPFMLEIATALACQMKGEVIPLQVIQVADPLAIERGKRVASERNTLFQWSTRIAARSGVPTFPVTRLARSVSEGILDTAIEEECDLVLMSWTIETAARGARMGQVLDPVVRRAPCDVAVVAFQREQLEQAGAPSMGDEICSEEGAPSTRIREILVPTAGGPHAPLATRLALVLAKQFGANASTVYVADAQATAEEIDEGHSFIQQTLARMRQQAQLLASSDEEIAALAEYPIESRVVPATSIVQGITNAAEGSDLVLIGASEESLIDQVLFGTIPEQVARTCPAPVVMVKRYRGLPRFWLQRAWDAISRGLPKLARQQQVAVHKEVRKGALPTVDYFVMIGLSAIIATYGLLQDSSAVIIGAMLVAPLFTPILALSLALVQADIRLLRSAIESTLQGVALAIGLAVLLTALSPLRGLTHEIVSRSQPNLFDLAVALASGAAGAYAVARKDVAAALPGVAIAAALVPPLGTTGVGLALGEFGIAQGGALLFTTNLIAIVLAGAVTLLLLGFRPAGRGVQREQLRLGIIISIVLLVLISIPLGAVFISSVNESQTRQTIQRVLTSELEVLPDLALVEFNFTENNARIEVVTTMYARSEVASDLAQFLSDELELALQRPVTMHIVSIPVTEITTQSR
ncbi:MAG TPA: DUF389 domain-containing protein [Anaerolineae bacterium]|nr:DUF389 domain-containing protein [Anaerolineae bacterium]